MSELPPAPTLTDVFDALQEASRNAAALGRVLHGPQAKKALTTLYPGFSERAFGYKKFIELLRAGHDAGRFRLETVEGHPQLTPASTTATARPTEQGRLKADLWTTLVSWDAGQRYWDRTRRRAIFVPTDEHGTALWETSPDDFAVVEPVPMQVQLEWMVDFANEQAPDIQERLLASLKNPAPGAFKKELAETRRSGAWRAKLRQRVTEHATDWATRHEIAPTSIFDPDVASVRRPSTRGSLPQTPPPASTRPDESTEVERLRARMHRIIDQMNYHELSALQIPASYLLEQ